MRAASHTFSHISPLIINLSTTSPPPLFYTFFHLILSIRFLLHYLQSFGQPHTPSHTSRISSPLSCILSDLLFAGRNGHAGCWQTRLVRRSGDDQYYDISTHNSQRTPVYGFMIFCASLPYQDLWRDQYKSWLKAISHYPLYCQLFISINLFSFQPLL